MNRKGHVCEFRFFSGPARQLVAPTIGVFAQFFSVVRFRALPRKLCRPVPFVIYGALEKDAFKALAKAAAPAIDPTGICYDN